MSQPNDHDALIDAIAACRFCTIGATGPLLCPKHAGAYGCARCGHAVSHTPGCIDLTCSCPSVISPAGRDEG